MKTDKNMIYHSVTSYVIGEFRLPIYGVKRQVNGVWQKWPPDCNRDQNMAFLTTCQMKRFLFRSSLYSPKKSCSNKWKKSSSQG